LSLLITTLAMWGHRRRCSPPLHAIWAGKGKIHCSANLSALLIDCSPSPGLNAGLALLQETVNLSPTFLPSHNDSLHRRGSRLSGGLLKCRLLVDSEPMRLKRLLGNLCERLSLHEIRRVGSLPQGAPSVELQI